MSFVTAADVPVRVVSDNAAAERRITPSWTIAILKAKLETVTGIPPSSQQLTLRLPHAPQPIPISSHDEETTQIASFPLQPYVELHVWHPPPPPPLDSCRPLFLISIFLCLLPSILSHYRRFFLFFFFLSPPIAHNLLFDILLYSFKKNILCLYFFIYPIFSLFFWYALPRQSYVVCPAFRLSSWVLCRLAEKENKTHILHPHPPPPIWILTQCLWLIMPYVWIGCRYTPAICSSQLPGPFCSREIRNAGGGVRQTPGFRSGMEAKK